MPLFAPGLSPELVDETVRLSQIMFPIVVLLGPHRPRRGAAAGQRASSGPRRSSPVLWNIVIIVVPGWRRRRSSPDDQRITVYAVAILVGTLAQLLYLLPSLRGLGPFPFSLGLRQPRTCGGCWC